MRSPPAGFLGLCLFISLLLASCASVDEQENFLLQPLAATPTKQQALNVIHGTPSTFMGIRAAVNSGTMYDWNTPSPIKGVSNLWLMMGKTRSGGYQFHVYLERTSSGKLVVDLNISARIVKLTPVSGGSEYKGFNLTGGTPKLFVGKFSVSTGTLQTLSNSQAAGKVTSASQGVSSGTGTLSALTTFKSGSTTMMSKNKDGSYSVTGIIVVPCEPVSCRSEKWAIARRLAGVVGHGGGIVVTGGAAITSCVPNPFNLLCGGALYTTREAGINYGKASRDYWDSLDDYDDCKGRTTCDGRKNPNQECQLA